MHFPEPMHHFDMITAEAAYVALGAANTRVHVLPTAKGIEHRVINGRVYIGGVAGHRSRRDCERVGEFQQRAFYYYEHWERLYDSWKDKMKALIADAQALPKPRLPDYEPLETVHAGKGVAANHALLDIYQKQIEGYHRMWHHHFEFLLLGYGAYMTFFDFCKKAFPEISDQAISRMVAGMEAEIFRPDEEVKRLARRAVELGVDAHFTDGMNIEQVLGRSRQGQQCGKEWLAELETSRNPWFNVSSGDGFYHYHRSWNDDLTLPFAALPGYIDKVKSGHQHRASDRAADRGARSSCRRLSRAARHRRGPRDLRPADHAGAPRLPLCRGAQILLRALVHQPLLQQDPRVRRSARRTRLLREARRMSSTSPNMSWRARSSI
jgi:pyruvate,water dikinase